MQLALQLIDQISADSYAPSEFEDEEKKRVLAAIDEKIAGKEIVVAEQPSESAGGQIIDLTAALRASLMAKKPAPKVSPAQPEEAAGADAVKERKGARRATPAVVEAVPRVRARK